ncbi:hypothetical protein [Kitasatospora sp. NPDC005748]|uniref:hypothetical protein n=1 Tax=Kitasatospora sp. NPDC005748 TaxID=3157063 RepID=UPI0033F95D55
MAAPNVPGMMDPNVKLAAEVGDPTAMRLLGRYFYRVRHEIGLAERWLLAGAEAGDAESMYDLSRFYWDQSANKRPRGQTEEAASEAWCRRAAESGWLPALVSMANRDPHEREFWLRGAAEGGAPHSMLELAELLEAKGETAEAERWYRSAIDQGVPSARPALASLQAGQGRSSEALRCAKEAEDDAKWSGAAGKLADLYHELGHAEEAAEWRAQALALRGREDEEARRHAAGAAPDLGSVVITAVVTTAIVPFVQAIASKVAEDAYGQARQLVHRLLRRGRESSGVEGSSQHSALEPGGEPGLAIVQDPDAGIALYLWSNASDEALRALSALDLDELTHRRPDQGQVQLVWYPASGTWQIRETGERRRPRRWRWLPRARR